MAGYGTENASFEKVKIAVEWTRLPPKPCAGPFRTVFATSIKLLGLGIDPRGDIADWCCDRPLNAIVSSRGSVEVPMLPSFQNVSSDQCRLS